MTWGRGRRGVVGHSALAGIGVSVGLMAYVAALGPSAAAPLVDRGRPPWWIGTHPSGVLVTVLLWSALIVGAVSVCAGLAAVRGGWRPRIRPLLAGGLLACLVLVATPAVGSTDTLDYAVYGRLAVLGESPYTHTPLQLRAVGDPVGRYAPHNWRHSLSVYGPLATATEWVAAELGQGSMARTVMWLKAMDAAAFLGTGLLLGRRAPPAGRARAHLLWTLNPIMIWQLVGSGHVDAIATVAAVAALQARRGLTAGALTGAAAAVKAPYGLVGLGLLWVARRSPRRLVGLALGVAAVVGASYAVAGAPAVADLAALTGHTTGIDPWRGAFALLRLNLHGTVAHVAPLVTGAVLAVLLYRQLPDDPVAESPARPALAVLLGWLVPAAYQYPWYDAPAFALLPMLPSRRTMTVLEYLLIAHGLIGSLAYLPGVYRAAQTPWLLDDPYVLHATRLGSVAVAAVGVAFLVYACWPRRGLRRSPPFGLPVGGLPLPPHARSTRR